MCVHCVRAHARARARVCVSVTEASKQSLRISGFFLFVSQIVSIPSASPRASLVVGLAAAFGFGVFWSLGVHWCVCVCVCVCERERLARTTHLLKPCAIQSERLARVCVHMCVCVCVYGNCGYGCGCGYRRRCRMQLRSCVVELHTHTHIHTHTNLG